MSLPPPRAKAIRLKCIDCSAGDKKEVRLCCLTTCPLWPWRMGEQPDSARTIQANLAAKRATPALEAPYPGCFGGRSELAPQSQRQAVAASLNETTPSTVRKDGHVE